MHIYMCVYIYTCTEFKLIVQLSLLPLLYFFFLSLLSVLLLLRLLSLEVLL